MMGSRSVADRPGSQSALKNANRKRLLDLVVAEGELTQAAIARRSGLAPATVSNIVRELVDEGVLAAAPDETGRRGRTVRLARSTSLAVGVDFGYRHVTVAVADTSRTIRATRRVDLEIGHDARKGVEQARTLIDEAVEEAAVGWDDVLGVGVGLPAPIDGRTRQLGAPSLLPGWVGLHIDDYLAEALGTDVIVENDANLGALAEHLWGAGRGLESIAYLRLPQALRGGRSRAGPRRRTVPGRPRRHRGRDRAHDGGRVRHRVPLRQPRLPGDGRGGARRREPAGAGARRRPHHRRHRRAGPSGRRRPPSGARDTGRHVGGAVANLCNLLNPERIVIGGELAVAGELLLAPMRETVARYGIPSAVATSEIVLGALGPNAHVLGALALVLRERSRK